MMRTALLAWSNLKSVILGLKRAALQFWPPVYQERMNRAVAVVADRFVATTTAVHRYRQRTLAVQ